MLLFLILVRLILLSITIIQGKLDFESFAAFDR